LITPYEPYPYKTSENERKALELLRTFLSDEQRACLDRERCFWVIGSSSGKRYRITYNSNFNVIAPNGWNMCFRPAPSGLGEPIYDIMLAQKLGLENDEEGALRVANWDFPRRHGGSLNPTSTDFRPPEHEQSHD